MFSDIKCFLGQEINKGNEIVGNPTMFGNILNLYRNELINK